MKKPSIRGGRFLGISLLAVCAALFLAVLLLLSWFASQPRSLEFITSRVEQSLKENAGGYRIEFGESEASWQGFSHALNMTLHNVRLLDSEGKTALSLPEIRARVKLAYLLIGRIRFEEIAISRPSIWLARGTDGSIRFGLAPPGEVSKETIPAQRGHGLETLLDLKAAGMSTESLVIEHAGMLLADEKSGRYWQVPLADIRLFSERGQVHALLDIAWGEQETPSVLSADFALVRSTQAMDGRLVFRNVNPAGLKELLPDVPYLTAVQWPLDGAVNLQLGFDGGVRSLAFHIKGDKGTLTLPEHFIEPLQFSSMEAKGAVSSDLQRIYLKEMTLGLRKATLKVTGDVSHSAEGWTVEAAAVAEGMPLDNLRLYWPISAVPKVRKWVTEHLSGGNVPHARLRLHLTPDILRHERKLDEEALDAAVDVVDAKVAYFHDLKPVTGVNGTVYFKGRMMDAALTSGQMYGATAGESHVIIPDMGNHEAEMTIEIPLTTPVSDIGRYLQQDIFKSAKVLNLNPDEDGGTFDGTLSLDFGLTPQVWKHRGLGWKLDGQLSNAKSARLMGKFDIAQGRGHLTVTQERVAYKGTALVSDVPVDLKLDGIFRWGQGMDATYVLHTLMPAEKLSEFDITIPDFVTGTLGIEATVTQHADASREIEARVALDQASIEWADGGLHKAAGVPAQLAFKAKESPNMLEFSSFQVQGDGIDVNGKARLALTTQLPEMLELSTFRWGAHDFSASILPDPQGMRTVTIKGKTLDARGWFDDAGDAGEARADDAAEEEKDYPDLLEQVSVQATINRLLMGEEGRELTNVTATMRCGERCDALEFQGALNEAQRLQIHIARDEEGVRQLVADSGDAGRVARTMGIFDDLEGGRLELRATFHDDTPDVTHLTGKLLIQDFTVRKAPVLAKILTLASLSGVLDVLNGKGISFEKLSAPFEWQNDVLRLTQARSVGPALGLTVEGTINTKARNLDLDGTIVPSYTLNSLVGKIPLLGEALVGGDGEGLFAARYGMSGPYENAKVTVNPLSMLTPGVFRGLFDLFDGDKASGPSKVGHSKKGAEGATN